VVNARGALAVGPTGTSAVLRRHGGTLVAAHAGAWLTLTDAERLAPRARLRLETVTWGADGLGWLTGHATDAAVAFRTADAGATWTPVPTGPGVPTAALAPCGAGSTWVLPVLSAAGRVTFRRTVDAGRTWRTGGSLPMAAELPAWGCSGDDVWSVTQRHGSEQVVASDDGGVHWAEPRRAPAGVVDLTPVGDGAGFAVSRHGGESVLWSLDGDGTAWHRLRLPGWVGRLGGSMSDD
jgi:hypothetical protein